MTTFVLPMKVALRERLLAGDLPLWDPYTECGTPFLAKLQTQVGYLPNTVACLFPLPWAYGLHVVFHLVIAFLGLRGWARATGLSEPAACVGGLCFASGGALACITDLSNVVATTAWLPTMAWGAVRLSTRGDRGGWLLFILGLVGAGLGGEPHVAVAGVGVAALLALLAAPASAVTEAGPAAWLVTTRRLLVGGALAAGLIAFQLLPFLELVSLSDRAEGLGLQPFENWTVGPAELVGFLVPDRDAFQPSGGDGIRGQAYVRVLYLGAGAVLAIGLSLAALVRAGRDERRRVLGPFLVVVGSVLLSFGSLTPLYALLYHLGYLRQFRYPAKFLLVAAVGLAMLAALGTERLLRLSGRGRFVPLALALGVVGLAVVTGDHEVWHVALFAALAGISMLVEKGRGALLVAVLAADLNVAHVKLQPSVPADSLFAATPSSTWLEENDGRAYLRPLTKEVLARNARDRRRGMDWAARQAVHDLRGKVPMAVGVRCVSGASALLLATHDQLQQRADAGPEGLPWIRHAAADVLLSPEPLPHPDLTPLAGTGERPILHRIAGSAPRLALVASWELASDPSAALDRCVDPLVSSGRHVVVEVAPPWPSRPPSERGESSLEVVESSPDERRYRVRTEQPVLLVLREGHHPGWRASVDGESADLLRVGGAFLGISVEAGEHEVELEFAPTSHRLGALVSGLVLLGCAVAWWRMGRRDDHS
ncbi:MAG: YfhO family protein [Acidobacteriota bacterium]